MQHNPPLASVAMSYVRIHRTVLPKPRAAGITEAQIDAMLTADARRFLGG